MFRSPLLSGLSRTFARAISFSPAGSVASVLATSVFVAAMAVALGDPVWAAPDPQTAVEENPVYQELRIPTPLTPQARTLVAAHRLELMGDDDGWIRVLARKEQTEKLRAAGLEFEVVVEDLQSHYQRKLAAEQERGGGNFGIFHTWSEALAEYEALRTEFPSLVIADTIGYSHEGRPLHAIKISDNPEIDEDEPEVLFDGVHHAREIMTVEMLIDFSRYLCENYGSDPVVTQLVDTREIWFVPIVNPDGLVHNEAIAPGGGGLWRKNRAVNGGSSCRGVDLNRNYDYEWGPSGSSGDPCAEDYRGTAPHSEPETMAHTTFIDSREFVTWQSYHSVAGMVLYPWGYTTSNTPDHAHLDAIATEMASQNGYQVGQPGEILYDVNGGSFDWGYGDTSERPAIFGFTTEIGGSGFWPSESERDPLIAENLHANLYLCQVAGAWLDLLSLAVDDGDNGRLDPGETAEIVATVRNSGVLTPAGNVTATLRCDDPYVSIVDASSLIGDLGPGEQSTTASDPLIVEVDPLCPEGRDIVFSVDFTGSGGIELSGSLSLEVGAADVIVKHDFESSDEGWSVDPSETASTGTFERIDPNPTEYQPGDDTTEPGVFAWITGQNSSVGVDDVDNGVASTRSPVVDLSAYQSVRLDLNYFFGQRDSGDDSGDFFSLDVSGDGGGGFVNLISVGDVTSPANWQSFEIDLEDVIDLSDQVVLRVQAADGPATGDIVEAGVDDVCFIDRGTGNDPPAAPVALSPVDGEVVAGGAELVVSNALDPEDDTLTYGFRVFSDPELTDVVASAIGIAEGTLTTSWNVTPPLGIGVYYWRAYAEDAEARGLYSEVESFEIESASDVPGTAGAIAAALRAGPSPGPGPVTIRYNTPAAAKTDLRIFDATGRMVRSLPGARWTEGWQEVVWDGRNEDGSEVAAGVYFVRLDLPTESRTVRVVRVE